MRIKTMRNTGIAKIVENIEIKAACSPLIGGKIEVTDGEYETYQEYSGNLFRVHSGGRARIRALPGKQYVFDHWVCSDPRINGSGENPVTFNNMRPMTVTAV